MAKKESKLQAEIRDWLRENGYHVEVFTCNAYQKGIPDLWVARIGSDHTIPGIPDEQWWVDVKKPKGSTLTKDQVQKWSSWEKLGIGVWILTGPDDSPLYDEPNWRDWWKPRYDKWLPRSGAEILEEFDDS